MASLRIALAQINATVGDLAGNGRKILDAAARAREMGADLVLFPELALCGYPPEDLLLKPRFLCDTRSTLENVARQIHGITAVVGFADSADAEVYNAAAVIEDGRVAHIYRKIRLPNYGVFDEERYFTPGSEPLVFPVKGVRVGVNICEDIWREGDLAERQARRHKVGVVLNLSASPFHAEKRKLRCEVVGRFARRTGATVCYCNLVGGQDELVFDGGSIAVSPSGEMLAAAHRFEEDLVLADTGPAGGISADRFAECELSKVDEIYRALVLGTRDYMFKNGFAKAVIGLSGGVDSAVTAAIAVDALGADHVTGVTMPSQYTSSATLTDAGLLAKNLGIPFLAVPIKPIYASYLKDLADAFGPDELGIEAENLQARIRGNILMALSNRFGWLVLTTGNKSEIAVGYCTLYGDMAGGLAVIKDVPKTVVYELARHVNERRGPGKGIPQSTIDRAPSAELKPDQKDSDSLPPYDILDEVLRLYVEEDAAPFEIVAAGFDGDLVERVVRMVDRNEYKRRQAPPGIKITPKAFGRDRRLPITNRYRASTPGEGA